MTEPRKIILRSAGSGGGPFRRLMSPGELGLRLKPFVFLDLFEFPGGGMGGGGRLHPHSGIATVTLFVEGQMHFDDVNAGKGILDYGGVEYVQAGGGIWHGRELSPGVSPKIRGFQLWIALPPALENAAPESHYLASREIAQVGPARVVLGTHQGVSSPLPAPEGITYLLVTLEPGESWTFQPNEGESIAWLAISSGRLVGTVRAAAGEIVMFEDGEEKIELMAGSDGPVAFVLGSARPHGFPLCLGNYSVHTSNEALQKGEARIQELADAIARHPPEQRGGAIPVIR